MKTIKKILFDDFPPLLKEINDPPKQLYIEGEYPSYERRFISVVGSRKHTHYGEHVTQKLLEGLRGYPVAIISGLALGIDSIAHKAALDVGLPTIAVPGSGLDRKVLYPRTHTNLARRILENNGCLLSEFEPMFKATRWSFPQRNRIMAGLSHAVLVIEATQKSGTLITSRLATEYNREVLTVPGSILSKTSEGPHMLIKLGATPVDSSNDILEALNLSINDSKELQSDYSSLSQYEKTLIKLLEEPRTQEELTQAVPFSLLDLNITLSSLELKGLATQKSGLWTKT